MLTHTNNGVVEEHVYRLFYWQKLPTYLKSIEKDQLEGKVKQPRRKEVRGKAERSHSTAAGAPDRWNMMAVLHRSTGDEGWVQGGGGLSGRENKIFMPAGVHFP